MRSSGRSKVPAAALREGLVARGLPVVEACRGPCLVAAFFIAVQPGKAPEDGGGDTKRKTECDLLH